MNNRKIILYPKSAMKPIILTDTSNNTLDEIQKKIINILKDNKISILTTDHDSIIIKPSEIQAVLVTNKDGHAPISVTKYSEDLKDDNGTTD